MTVRIHYLLLATFLCLSLQAQRSTPDVLGSAVEVRSEGSSRKLLLREDFLKTSDVVRYRSAKMAKTSLVIRMETLEEPLFNVVIDDVAVWGENETVVWQGHTGARRGEGTFLLARTGTIVKGHVESPAGRRYHFQGDFDKSDVEMVLSAEKPQMCQVEHEPTGKTQAHTAGIAPSAATTYVIDWLAVYTPEVRIAEGGTNGILNTIRATVAYTNLAFANTGLNIRLNIVAAVEVPYTEVNSAHAALRELASGTGPVARQVRELRDAWNADLVAMFISKASDAGGVAYIGGSSVDSSRSGFSVNVVFRGNDYTNEVVAHETGHNLGCGHARSDPGNGSTYPFAWGFKDERPKAFKDIMAYPCPNVFCATTQAYSNPDQTVEGRPFGRPASASDSADCRLGIFNSAPNVVRYREPAPDIAPPFGHLDSPKPPNNINLSGQIGVTGWALDDRGVKKVDIWRSPFGADAPLTYIGDAIFVEGARPDVAQLHPRTPNHTRAGWGYALLTYGLPDRGANNRFRLHAFAEDEAGNRTKLGSVDTTFFNEGRTQPFGTIDFPVAGETLSASQDYRVSGWVLGTPGRRVND